MVGAVVLVATGRDPLSVYRLYIVQAAGTWPRLADTFAASTPLLLAGVGTALAFRAGFFNVGLEGAVYVGALASAWAGAEWTVLPGPAIAVGALLLGMLAGALWLLVPALLRAYLSIDEVVTTLMLNYVAIALTTYIVLDHFLYQTVGNAQSPPVAASAELPALVSGTTLTAAAPIALCVVLAYGWVLRRTRLGTEIRLVGDNPRFAAAMGFSIRRTALVTMLTGGALGGLAGSFVVLGVTGNFTANFSTAPGYGYTGIAVAVLGRNSWFGLLLASLFFGALASAGGVIQLFGNVPIALTQILQGTLMIFAGVQFVRRRRGRRRRSGRVPKSQPVVDGSKAA
jgi:simple sugar transport system permease protein